MGFIFFVEVPFELVLARVHPGTVLTELATFFYFVLGGQHDAFCFFVFKRCQVISEEYSYSQRDPRFGNQTSYEF